MRNGFRELRARIRAGGALDVVRTWRWKALLERTGLSFTPPPLPQFLSSGSIRGVSKAPKLLLFGLLILQLLVLTILRSSSSRSHTATPAFVGTSRTLHTYTKLGGQEPPSAGELPRENGVLSTALDDAASHVSEDVPRTISLPEQDIPERPKQTSENQLETTVADDPTREEAEQQHEFTKVVDENPADDESETHDPEAEQEELLSASETAILEEDPLCKGGRIFVYQLPKRFNSALVANCSVLNPWLSLCDAFSNGGLGKPMTTTPWPSSKPSPWFYTEQFSGELIFHTRILRHPCVTKDPSSANIFYVPFYAGLDVSRYLWRPSKAEERDRLGRKLVKWLLSQPAWSRQLGRDHFTMIGRITWDFRRAEDKEWGSGLLNLPAMKNMTRLIIERDPWAGGEFGVPYPTSFHPKTEHQLQEWQEFVRVKERGLLFSFAGATRKKFPNDFRLELLAQCSDAAAGGGCSAIDCSDGRCETPEPVMELFLNSSFCLQPRGDTYTRRSIFDSMLAGCIPVFFWNQSSYWQYGMFFPEEDESFSVFIDREDVRKGVKIEQVLSGLSEERVRRMRSAVIDLIPRLLYATPDHELAGADAFDTAIDGVLRSMLRMNLRAGASRNSSTH